MRGSCVGPRTFLIVNTKEETNVTNEEYKTAVLRAAEISEKVTDQLDDAGLEWFEEYCEIYKDIVIYELENK